MSIIMRSGKFKDRLTGQEYSASEVEQVKGRWVLKNPVVVQEEIEEDFSMPEYLNFGRDIEES